MKDIAIKIAIIAIAIIVAPLVSYKVQKLKKENERLLNNQELMLTQKQFTMPENQKYRASDSLNAARVSELELTLKEYKQYRDEDLKLIKQLKAGKSDLQKIITSQSETISTLSAKLSDSIRIDTATNQIDTLKRFDYKSKWTDVKGCIDLKRDTIMLQIKNRESLKIAETAIYKRFLGFLWKINKVKNRQVDIVSENPNTEILNCEYISIKH